MGTLSGGNGGGTPSDGGGDPFDGLPDLPPEWGTVVVPDDPAELANEAEEVRRELRREGRRNTWRRLFGLPTTAGGDGGLPPVRLPILIMSIAVLAALISMFALGWQRDAIRPSTRATESTVAATTSAKLRNLPALELIDNAGREVALRSLIPSVILLTDGCGDCSGLVQETLAATPFGVGVATVARTSSPPKPAATGVRSLGDPVGELRQAMGLAGDARPAAVLVDRSGAVLRTVSGVNSVDAYRADLPRLAA
ncbi:MAG TPA: hypothetical protein VGJ53_16185 [Micromonosporaceae bacterium]|jgi:hypothetical protein